MGQVSPPYEWEGLRISARPDGEIGPVLLTGQTVNIRVRVESPNGQSRIGQLAFTWSTGTQSSSPVPMTFALTSGGFAEFVISWRPPRAGYAEFRLHLYKAYTTVEENTKVEPNQFAHVALGADTCTLYSSSIRDAEEWAAERRRDAEQAERDADQRRRTSWLIVLAGIAAAAGIATVILLIKG